MNVFDYNDTKFKYIILCGSEFTCRTNYELEIEHIIIYVYDAYFFFQYNLWNIPIVMPLLPLNRTLYGILFLNKWLKVIVLKCIPNNRALNFSGLKNKRGGG